jgi:hypothetical protein
MSPQADFIVSNGTGAAVRSDLNVQFAAIVSNNSGATEPATMYAYQWWADTTTGLLKLRNSANSGWVTIRQLDGEFSTVPVENGSAAAPSIYFKDSGTDTGIYSPGADQVAVSTGGTGRLFIDASGRLLVGTSNYASNGIAVFQGNTSAPTGAGAIDIRLGTTRPTAADTAIGFLRFMSTSDAGGNYQYASISASSDGVSSSDTDIPGRLVFSTTADGANSPTERMRIKSNGDVGTFGAVDAIFVASSEAAGVSANLIIGKHSATSVFSGTASFVVRTNGNVINTNNSYGSISDAKLKENVVDAGSQWDDLKALRPVNYNFKEGQTHTQIGLLSPKKSSSSPLVSSANHPTATQKATTLAPSPNR